MQNTVSSIENLARVDDAYDVIMMYARILVAFLCTRNQSSNHDPLIMP